MATKKTTFITPPVIAVWPKLDTPDSYQAKDRKGNPKGEPKVRYTTDVKAAPGHEEAFDKMRKSIEAYAKKVLPDIDKPKTPFKPEMEKDGDKRVETGKLLMTATSGVKYKPPVFDAKNNKLPEGLAIGGGSLIRLEVSLNDYEISDDNAGVNLYINAVQVLDLVEKGVGKSNFEEADGFVMEEEARSSFGAKPQASSTSDMDDEIPF
jgi:hypothetical protein